MTFSYIEPLYAKMFKMKRLFLLFLGIVVIAGILRFYQLGVTPISLEWDEVALGYDAYSVLKTGKDQFGTLLPLTFRSLDDFKPPIYEYLTIPAVFLFGLNEFSTRLPSAFIGFLTIIATFILSYSIFKNVPKLRNKTVYISLLSSLFLAISSWHLQFSRAAFEANISVFITVLSVIFFILGLNNFRLFLLSALFFGLDLFSYHSARVVSPILMITLFILFNKKLPVRKYLIYYSIIYAFFMLNFLPILFSSDAQIRFKATNIFNPGARYLNEPDLPSIFLDKRLFDKNAGYELAGKIFHNQRFIYFDYNTLKKSFFNYLSNFGFDYLFIKGDAPLHHAPNFGMIQIVFLPFISIGLLYLIFRSLDRYTAIIPIWLLLAPIPDAVTREAPHSVRTELILPIYQILAAIGMIVLITYLARESKFLRLAVISIITFFLMINNSYYLHQYYVHTNYELSKNWLYGRKEAVTYTEKEKSKYDEIIISMKVDMPYIFWLFYSKYNPSKYLSEGGTVSGGFADERNHFDKYQFRNFNYNLLPKDKNILLVGIPDDFPPDADVVKNIYYLDGSEALKIAKNKK